MNDITIVVVDDHAMFRKGLCALINMFASYRILFDAVNGTDFIQRIDPDNLPSIVLLDITMPGMDGFDTAEWIKANYPEIAILALSTMDNDAAILKMVRQGARGYLLKDAEPEELKQAFHEVLTRGYYYNDLMTRKILRSLPELADKKSDPATILNITAREMEFLRHACSEKTYLEISREMFLSERTIDGYRDNLFRKLNVSTRVGLVLYAIKNKLVSL